MPLKKRRVELHTVTEQLLFIGGGRAAQGQCADCAVRDGTAKADEALGLVSHEGEGADARLRVLRDAARSLSRAMRAVRTLELSSPAAVPDVGRGVDFYDEVRRFEILLIERALLHSGGSQVRAASLLGLKTTTLNSKIKGYNIDLEDLA
jgi:DNA-binding NtrC family response regulator